MQTGRLVPWHAPVYQFLSSVNVAIPPGPRHARYCKKGLKYKFKRSKLSLWKEAMDFEKGNTKTTGRYVHGIGYAKILLVNN
jgi:hypothetical protein